MRGLLQVQSLKLYRSRIRERKKYSSYLSRVSSRSLKLTSHPRKTSSLSQRSMMMLLMIKKRKQLRYQMIKRRSKRNQKKVLKKKWSFE
jgi:hypothetical protein